MSGRWASNHPSPEGHQQSANSVGSVGLLYKREITEKLFQNERSSNRQLSRCWSRWNLQSLAHSLKSRWVKEVSGILVVSRPCD